jgi:hypothetical protein
MTLPYYNPNVPRPGDSIATSQPDFLGNFSTLFTAFSQNHVDLDAALAGKHTIIELPAKTTAFLSNVGELSVYSRAVDDQGVQVYLKYQGTTEEFLFSCYQIYQMEPLIFPFNNIQTRYFTFLPGNIILYFGTYEGGIGPGFIPQFIQLTPPVATDIISMDFCGATINPIDKPNVSLQVEPNGRILKINVRAFTAGDVHYIVMGKI